ncbi:hypothetical protein MFLO_11390 [Listeria floridensis FSL S10-1187]|uniref:Uncharacterized protein n=1 Tax=Listeria floridensis FSL S10-1187 TaxID=1265817 RepID=A0ABP3AXM2_9LIST|nr:hypothetical protein [Listeria floridensis]EUJ29185.1 hypothetical protein MFLO_11390 [Listeria floridensis FSL S10-1187]
MKSSPGLDCVIQLSRELEISLDQLIFNHAKEIEKMKKALLVVVNYTASGDKTWGKEAKDYGTRDLLAHLSVQYLYCDWRPVTGAELETVLDHSDVGFYHADARNKTTLGCYQAQLYRRN